MLALFPDGIRRMSAPYRSLGQRSVYVSFVVISQTGQTWAQFLFPLQDVKKYAFYVDEDRRCKFNV